MIDVECSKELWDLGDVSHSLEPALVTPIILVVAGVGSPFVQCQRHIHVDYFVYHQTDTTRPCPDSFLRLISETVAQSTRIWCCQFQHSHTQGLNFYFLPALSLFFKRPLTCIGQAIVTHCLYPRGLTSGFCSLDRALGSKWIK